MIRLIRQDEIDQDIDLSAAAFAVQLTPEKREERRKLGVTKDSWGYFEDDQLAAKLAILPLKIYWQGQIIPMGGIAQVATYPEKRRKGMVGQLMEHSLKVMRDNGQIVSMLNPFAYGFYRKYGWELFTEIKHFQLETSQLPRIKDSEGYVKRKTKEDWPELAPIYEKFAKKFDGLVARDEEWWPRGAFRLKEGYVAVYYNDDGEAQGYMLYRLRERTMTVFELVYLNPAAYRGLWHFICNHDSMIDQLTFKAPLDDAFVFAVDNPTMRKQILTEYMIRIVDVEKFVRTYRFNPLTAGQRITVQLNDRYAPWNEGIWEITVGENGDNTVTKVDSVQNDEEVISFDIHIFTALLMSHVRPRKLHEAGQFRASESKKELLETMIPHKNTFFLDYF